MAEVKVENLLEKSIVESLANKLLKFIFKDNKKSPPPEILELAGGDVKELINEVMGIEIFIDYIKNKKASLHLAVLCNNVEIIKQLIKEEKDIKIDGAPIKLLNNKLKLTALNLAAFLGHIDVVKYLIGIGAKAGIDTLYAAILNGQTEAVRHLANKDIIDYDATEYGITILGLASLLGHKDIVEHLIKIGVDVNGKIIGVDLNEKINRITPLILTAIFNRIDIAKILVSAGAYVDSPKDGMSALHLAAIYGQTNFIKYLLDEAGANVNQTGTEGDTPLHCAAEYAAEGELAIVDILIKAGANINAVVTEGEYKGFTPLHFAALNGNTDAARLLIENGANPNATENNGHTPLHLAAKNGHINMVEYLINSNLTIKNKKGETPLDIAKKHKHDNVIKYITNMNVHDKELLFSANKNKDDNTNKKSTNDEITAENLLEKSAVKLLAEKIIGFILKSQKDVPEELLKYASENVEDLIKQEIGTEIKSFIDYMINKRADLHLAVLFNNVETIKQLIKEEKDIKIDGAPIKLLNNKLKSTALNLAAFLGHIDVVKYLIDIGAKTELDTLYAAILNGQTEVVRHLANKDIIDYDSTEYGITILSLASLLGHKDIVEHLISIGVDINKEVDIISPLNVAAMCNKTDVIKILVDAGADVNSPKNGVSALGFAAAFGNTDLIKYLLDSGANINKTSAEGYTALHYAAEEGEPASVEVLIKAGANINAVVTEGVDKGFTPLHIAALEGNTDIARLLIKNGANSNAAENDGYTPLHLAAQEGHINMVEYLINSNADLTIKNKEGETPLDIARKNKHANVIKYITNINNMKVRDKKILFSANKHKDDNGDTTKKSTNKATL